VGHRPAREVAEGLFPRLAGPDRPDIRKSRTGAGRHQAALFASVATTAAR